MKLDPGIVNARKLSLGHDEINAHDRTRIPSLKKAIPESVLTLYFL